MNYQESLDYIASVNWKGSCLGLERINELMENLGNPQDELRFIHIAGTNGKGSTSAMLSFVLEKAGYKVGLFISPYILRFNERMQINNRPISDEELAEVTTYLRPFAEELEDLPTEFELNTAIGIEYFKRNKCDIVILEVGMGGELDSTNIIKNTEIAVITEIGYDHVKELGPTIKDIARTKAGIIKSGCEVVLYKNEKEEVNDIIKEICKTKNTRLNIAEFDKIEQRIADIRGQKFEYKGLGEFYIPLLGKYQLNNIAVVFKIIEVLNQHGYIINNEDIKTGLKKVKWPGRFEIVSEDPLFIVDGAHNPDGIKATAMSIKNLFPDKKINFLFGVMADKNVDKMLEEIIPMADCIFTVTPDNPRAMKAEELSELVRKKQIKSYACESVDEAVRRVLKAANESDSGVAVAIGSLYMIGDIITYIKNM